MHENNYTIHTYIIKMHIIKNHEKKRNKEKDLGCAATNQGGVSAGLRAAMVCLGATNGMPRGGLLRA